jgi:hypothetical protein
MASENPHNSMPRDEQFRTTPAKGKFSSQDDTRFATPTWHADALREAEEAVRAGRAQFVDWTDAKNRLRRIAAGHL